LVLANVLTFSAGISKIAVAKVLAQITPVLRYIALIATNVFPIISAVNPVQAQVLSILTHVAMIVRQVLSQRKSRSQHCKAQQGSYFSSHIASLASGLMASGAYKHWYFRKVAGGSGGHVRRIHSPPFAQPYLTRVLSIDPHFPKKQSSYLRS
jgi:hypothetical protein